MSDKTLFQKIADKEIPALLALETEAHVAFADINPSALGHLLLIPRTPYRWWLEMPESEWLALTEVAQSLAQKLKAATAADYIQLNIIGDEVPHVHIHLIPRFENRPASKVAFNETATKEIIARL